MKCSFDIFSLEHGVPYHFTFDILNTAMHQNRSKLKGIELCAFADDLTRFI